MQFSPAPSGDGNQSWDWPKPKYANKSHFAARDADLSGHGPMTTVVEEKETIVFFSMLPTRQGSIPLVSRGGHRCFLHWLWFLAPVYILSIGAKRYSSLLWNILEVLCLFAIVLIHEFGHALACRR